ncbi:hypothetical protein ACNFJN_15470 [Xenorhabdus budapestensis]|uniref:hypothetical protein n=1 Tax=Xenorhabdus budapestensis TaxID=290110 RepID=UPI003A843AEE
MNNNNSNNYDIKKQIEDIIKNLKATKIAELAGDINLSRKAHEVYENGIKSLRPIIRNHGNVIDVINFEDFNIFERLSILHKEKYDISTKALECYKLINIEGDKINSLNENHTIKDIELMLSQEKNKHCGDKFNLIDSLNKAIVLEEEKQSLLLKFKLKALQDGSYTKKVDKNNYKMNALNMLWHFTGKSGQELTLSEIGIHDEVRKLMEKSGAFGKEGSVQSRFISQIQDGERLYFKNQYDFAKETIVKGIDPLWAIGGATVSGSFTNINVDKVTDGYLISGVINYELCDRFASPWDIFNWSSKELNWYGEPYDITGKWQEDISFGVSEEVYENNIKPLIEQKN